MKLPPTDTLPETTDIDPQFIDRPRAPARSPKSSLRSVETYGAAGVIGALIWVIQSATDRTVVITAMIVAAICTLGFAALRTWLKRHTPPVLLICIFLAALVAPVGCTSPTSDRGSWGEVATAVDVDFNFDGHNRQSDPSTETSGIVSTVDSVETGAATAAVVETALASGARVVIVNVGGITVSATGSTEAASPGDTTMPTTGPDIDGSLEVPVSAIP